MQITNVKQALALNTATLAEVFKIAGQSAVEEVLVENLIQTVDILQKEVLRMNDLASQMLNK